MTIKLPPIAPIEPPQLDPPSISPAGSDNSISFKDVLGSAIKNVESAKSSANQAADQFLAGEGGDLHSVILQGQRADLEFQMFLQVRNKVVSAYQEVMRMQM
jgi:flagellar hook-basal body complex protein FliE